MTLKTMYVVVNYNPTTKEMISVSDPARPHPMTRESAQKLCDDLNPTDTKFVRCRVGVLVVDEP